MSKKERRKEGGGALTKPRKKGEEDGPMPPSVPDTGLVKAVAATAGLGALYALLRHFPGRRLHPLVEAHARMAADFPGLAAVLSEFGGLVETAPAEREAYEALLTRAAEVCALDCRVDDQRTPWNLSRGCEDVYRLAEKLLAAHGGGGVSADRYADSLHYREEVLPQLREHLDNLLHNHLQKRR